jgi:hypothetical protein
VETAEVQEVLFTECFFGMEKFSKLLLDRVGRCILPTSPMSYLEVDIRMEGMEMMAGAAEGEGAAMFFSRGGC